MALTPTRASCYNNRAQIHRFNSNISAALQDLNKAIQISHGRGRSACQAFCQRGMLLHSEWCNHVAKVRFGFSDVKRGSVCLDKSNQRLGLSKTIWANKIWRSCIILWWSWVAKVMLGSYLGQVWVKYECPKCQVSH